MAKRQPSTTTDKPERDAESAMKAAQKDGGDQPPTREKTKSESEQSDKSHVEKK